MYVEVSIMNEEGSTLRKLFIDLESKLIGEEVIQPNSDLSELFFEFKNTLNSFCHECGVDSIIIRDLIKTFNEIAEMSSGPYVDKYPTKDAYHGVMWKIHTISSKQSNHIDSMGTDWKGTPPKRFKE